MLWYKAWLETRWRFLIGIALLLMSACGVVWSYPHVLKLMPLVPKDTGTELGRRIGEAVELARNYRGYVWSQWFRQNLAQMWTVFAAILGAGGLLSQTGGGGTLFTLSLPVTRTRLLAIRAVTALVELLVLALVPSLALTLLSPAIGQSYSLVDAMVHATCLFIAGTVFFSLAFLLSAIFSDVWRPALLALSAAMVLAIGEQIFGAGSRYGLFRVMSAEVWFRGGSVPLIGLLVSAAVSVAMLYGAAAIIARRDF